MGKVKLITDYLHLLIFPETNVCDNKLSPKK